MNPKNGFNTAVQAAPASVAPRSLDVDAVVASCLGCKVRVLYGRAIMDGTVARGHCEELTLNPDRGDDGCPSFQFRFHPASVMSVTFERGEDNFVLRTLNIDTLGRAT